MKHFVWRSRQRNFRKVWRFCCDNGQLLFLTMLICVGGLAGAMCFKHITQENMTAFMNHSQDAVIPHDFAEACLAVLSSAIYGWLFLVVLFLLGLTAYGCPLILPIPLVFGFCVGIMECYTYSKSGMWMMVKGILIPSITVGIAMIIAIGQALKMSCSFSRQLLPSHAHCGGLWQDFKGYLLRFGVSFLLVLFGAIVASLLRLI